jgi:hypothetical protein
MNTSGSMAVGAGGARYGVRSILGVVSPEVIRPKSPARTAPRTPNFSKRKSRANSKTALQGAIILKRSSGDGDIRLCGTHRDIVPGIRESSPNCNSAVEWRPDRLRSLWDIMKPFSAHFFLTQIRMMETVVANPKGAEQWEGSLRVKAQAVFRDIPQDCIDLGLDASRRSAEKIVKLLSQNDCSHEQFRGLVGSFKSG